MYGRGEMVGWRKEKKNEPWSVVRTREIIDLMTAERDCRRVAFGRTVADKGPAQTSDVRSGGRENKKRRRRTTAEYDNCAGVWSFDLNRQFHGTKIFFLCFFLLVSVSSVHLLLLRFAFCTRNLFHAV